jgi:hypothetical protein
MSIQACAVCATTFDTLQGKYAPDGTIVCLPCGERLAAEKATLEKKNAGSAFVGACGAVLIALLSFVLEHRIISFLLPLMAVFFGGGTAYTALRNPDARAALGGKRIPTVILGISAVVLALLSLAASALFTE